MSKLFVGLVWICLLAHSGVLLAPLNAAEPAVNFGEQIRPLLMRNCFTCHGPDEGTREADLRLDQLADDDSALADTFIQPGDAEGSELYRRLLDDQGSRMPPIDSGLVLSPEEIELIGRWIDQGASREGHWSFQTVAAEPNASLSESQSDMTASTIDSHVRQKLNRQGLTPSPPADAATLIRRVHLDLTGLPPTTDQVREFVADQRPDAYQRMVDQALASPHFGERWGRHWLDLARYADSGGYLGDKFRPGAYHHRDWVIDAVNQDMPFDQFTIEQIAGDLIEDATPWQKVATGFHRHAMKNEEAGADMELNRVTHVVDQVSTVGSVWLGLTVGCAQCHSHKFEPISHHEFYGLYAFFNNAKDLDLKMPAEDADDAAPALPIIVAEKSPRQTFVHLRGDHNQRGDEVEPGVPAFLHPMHPRGDKPDRLDLARWIVDPANPLTPRVAVNRYWKHLFGRGLVDTVDNLGISGAAPSHPELLDALAAQFVRDGWSRKTMIRRILMSSTYRQQSVTSRADALADPQNVWLARQSRFRLDAEVVRDMALTQAGLLDATIGGPSIRPPLSASSNAFARNTGWKLSKGGDQVRRGMYVVLRRATLYPMLLMFDAPDTTASCAVRDRSNTPLQALTLLNDPVFVRCAKSLGILLCNIEQDNWPAVAFERVLGRQPSDDEAARLERLQHNIREQLQDAPADELARWSEPAAEGVEPIEQATRSLVARCLLNLDETITRE
ncbi:Planctomycete cytochrome C [Roseimaritima multifibrata]|uniref:Planctomycete cytochrome C n=1 Tax=Roseimaritima multifibrata TaxID=1930274 RepID=A0A517MFN3_9BACT|nr:PSD1 and planctomycete cytochrome C domain-containing protein [Roseimaritima multifibrata]QDS93656.1 Planctomycete cytochrome C [Roseimaritima multifibrata]